MLGLFLLLVWMNVWLQTLLDLIMLLKCGPFFANTMSPLVSLPILLPYVKSSCHSRVTV